MDQQFYAARWQNYRARRVGQTHLMRVIRANSGENHPDYQDIEARRRMRFADTDKPAQNSGHDYSRD